MVPRGQTLGEGWLAILPSLWQLKEDWLQDIWSASPWGEVSLKFVLLEIHMFLLFLDFCIRLFPRNKNIQCSWTCLLNPFIYANVKINITWERFKILLNQNWLVHGLDGNCLNLQWWKFSNPKACSLIFQKWNKGTKDLRLLRHKLQTCLEDFSYIKMGTQ
jgi:hypothetical protein